MENREKDWTSFIIPLAAVLLIGLLFLGTNWVRRREDHYRPMIFTMEIDGVVHRYRYEWVYWGDGVTERTRFPASREYNFRWVMHEIVREPWFEDYADVFIFLVHPISEWRIEYWHRFAMDLFGTIQDASLYVYPFHMPDTSVWTDEQWERAHSINSYLIMALLGCPYSLYAMRRAEAQGFSHGLHYFPALALMEARPRVVAPQVPFFRIYVSGRMLLQMRQDCWDDLAAAHPLQYSSGILAQQARDMYALQTYLGNGEWGNRYTWEEVMDYFAPLCACCAPVS